MTTLTRIRRTALAAGLGALALLAPAGLTAQTAQAAVPGCSGWTTKVLLNGQSRIRDVDLDRTGVYASAPDRSSLLYYSQMTNSVRTIASNLDSPGAIQYRPSLGAVEVGTGDNVFNWSFGVQAQVLSVNASTGRQTILTRATAPRSITAIDTFGTLIGSTSPFNGTGITLYRSDGSQTPNWSPGNAGALAAVIGNSYVWATDPVAGTLRRIPFTGGPGLTVSTVGGELEGLAVTKDYAYVSVPADNRIERVSLATGEHCVIVRTTGPTGLAIYPGNIPFAAGTTDGRLLSIVPPTGVTL